MTIPIYCPDEIYQEMKDGYVSQKITELYTENHRVSLLCVTQ